MTRVKIAAAIIVVIIIYSVSALFILRSQNRKLTSGVEEVARLWDNEDYDGAYESAMSLIDIWHEYEHIVTVIVNDDHLRELNISIAKIPALIENQSTEVEAEIKAIQHEIDHIFDAEKPTLYNIL